MNLAIIGSRSFYDAKLANEVFQRHFSGLGVKAIVSGGARGADSCAAGIAAINGLTLIEHIPDWETHGKSAGFIRNKDIIRDSDWVLAFWDGKSKGTASSLAIAKGLKKPTIIIYF